MSAFLAWLSRGYEIGGNPTWRGQNTIPTAALIPVDKLEPQRGEAIFNERCTSCHGTDGQGVFVGDKRPGPLWGPRSWNDGAGASRVYTLAGIIRYTMPYLDPGSLTDEEAQQLAAYINSKPRPSYPFKDRTTWSSHCRSTQSTIHSASRRDSGTARPPEGTHLSIETQSGFGRPGALRQL